MKLHGFPDHITYVIGTNSFEGNQYYQFDRELSYSNLDSIFEITNGFEEGQATVARRYKYIPKENQQMVLEKYFEVHQELLGVDKFEDIDEEGAKLIAGFIYGDLGYRLPAYEQSLLYSEMGLNLFSYYLDVSFPYDMLLQSAPKYGFGHSNDVPVTFGWANYDIVWRIIYCNTTPDPWMVDLDATYRKQYLNQVYQTGSPDELHQHWWPFLHDRLRLTI